MITVVPVLTKVNEAVKSLCEEARRNKQMGSSLQCAVSITFDGSDSESLKHEAILRTIEKELADMLVVSSITIGSKPSYDPEWQYKTSVKLGEEKEWEIMVYPAEQHKCPRCWRYVAPVEDTLCGRCEEVVGDSVE